MTYTATATTVSKTLDHRTFTNRAAAKAWALDTVRDGVSIVISDAEMPSRHIRLASVGGKNVWTGTAPKSWY